MLSAVIYCNLPNVNPCDMYMYRLRDNKSFSPAHTQASEDLLCQEGEVEAAMESRLSLASALARQWFGVLLVARTPQDQ